MSVSINGVEVAAAGQTTKEFAAARELLRQRAVMVGILSPDAADDAAVESGLEELLAREVSMPEPAEEECRRYYEANPQEFRSGDLVHVRHILFQVTPSVPIPELRARAEQVLNGLLREPDRFEAAARELSNCPSGQQGGNLGQIGRGDTVPEFEKALFRIGPDGLLRDLVKTRYGFHIVSIDQRIRGKMLPFDVVQSRIADRLRAQVSEKALRQYISILAGQAEIVGVELDESSSPLVQ
jgi:peptidyl-prolyl cis-trans isomerase C